VAAPCRVVPATSALLSALKQPLPSLVAEAEAVPKTRAHFSRLERQPSLLHVRVCLRLS